MTAEPSSPKIFPSQILPDEPQLCFNKAHFTRSDFDVQRFMNLARRRAALKEIHNDLRVYLKSIQNSMIELINDDYADFVHLSSNLVSLKESIDKIDHDLNNFWTDFQASTKPTIDVADQIETKCEELSRNRSSQIKIRNRIIFITSLERLARSLAKVPEPITIMWLEQLTSAVVDATAFKEDVEEGSKEELAYNKVVNRCRAVLGEQAILQLKGDCQLLPLILSVLSLTGCTDQLVANIISAVLVPQVGQSNTKKVEAYKALDSTLTTVKKIRADWSERLGTSFAGHVEHFLDQTLLTFLITYLDEHLVTVLCPTVPADTKQFHRCFLLISQFITEYPHPGKHRSLLKQLRGKFQLPMFFKMSTTQYSRKLNDLIDPEKFALRTTEEKKTDEGEGDDEPVDCVVSHMVLTAIHSVWSDDVFLYPLADKLWDFTLRMIGKHHAWTKAMLDHIQSSKSLECFGMPKWIALMKIRSDAMKVDQKVFDTALEVIWVKLRDLGVDPQPFGQCLTKFSQNVKNLCTQFDEVIRVTVAEQMKKEFDLVNDVPKQYRWTKKPAPITTSAYVGSAHDAFERFENAASESGYDSDGSMVHSILTEAYAHFVSKVEQVLHTVDATGSSLSRFKKREGSTAPEGDSDETKIRTQIALDAEECDRRAKEKELQIPQLTALITRVRDALNETTA